ncbi:hypothetical protein PROFUN_12888 [Planoprotostelium fungivorum]|uniref:Uncharacterized protein n=1 Tax=Planoprotostelium fungivorum TaxID=1890364 RepID=A0A2P6MWM5_9EUKA|nr:hypothetical protein PROFUN_12888 [Planoprotostelium fungivorum]
MPNLSKVGITLIFSLHTLIFSVIPTLLSYKRPDVYQVCIKCIFSGFSWRSSGCSSLTFAQMSPLELCLPLSHLYLFWQNCVLSCLDVVYGHHIRTKQFNESLFIKNDFKPKKAKAQHLSLRTIIVPSDISLTPLMQPTTVLMITLNLSAEQD